jgi:hypothetical protein
MIIGDPPQSMTVSKIGLIAVAALASWSALAGGVLMLL